VLAAHFYGDVWNFLGTVLTLFVSFFNWDREAEKATARVKEAHRNHRLESGLDAA
jgi:hypothetical protein